MRVKFNKVQIICSEKDSDLLDSCGEMRIAYVRARVQRLQSGNQYSAASKHQHFLTIFSSIAIQRKLRGGERVLRPESLLRKSILVLYADDLHAIYLHSISTHALSHTQINCFLCACFGEFVRCTRLVSLPLGPPSFNCEVK